MTEEELFEKISVALSERLRPLPHPTDDDWAKILAFCDCELDKDFVNFINLMSQYNFAVMETFVAVDLDRVDHARKAEYGVATITGMYKMDIVELATSGVVSPNLIPFAAVGNGDMYCLAPGSEESDGVMYIYHEDDYVEHVSSSFLSWLLSEVREYQLEIENKKR